MEGNEAQVNLSAWISLGAHRSGCRYSCSKCPQDEFPLLWGKGRLNQGKRKEFEREVIMENGNKHGMDALTAAMPCRCSAPVSDEAQQQERRRAREIFEKTFEERCCDLATRPASATDKTAAGTSSTHSSDHASSSSNVRFSAVLECMAAQIEVVQAELADSKEDAQHARDMHKKDIKLWQERYKRRCSAHPQPQVHV